MNEILEYSEVIEITQNPMFWGILIGILLFTSIVYLIVGVLRSAKTPGGRVLPKRMIMTSGYWIAFCIWVLIPTTLVLSTIIFPFWLL